MLKGIVPREVVAGTGRTLDNISLIAMLPGILGGTPGCIALGLLLAGTLGGTLEGGTLAAMPPETLGGIPGYAAPELLLTGTPYGMPEVVVLVVTLLEIL